MITLKRKDAVSNKFLLASLLILLLSNSVAFGQEQAPETETTQRPPASASETTTQPTPRKKPKNSAQSERSQPSDSADSPEDYPAPTNMPPVVDYMTAAEQYQKELDAQNRKRAAAEAQQQQRQMQEMQRQQAIEDEQRRQAYEQNLARQAQQQQAIQERQRQEKAAQQQDEESKKAAAASAMKWLWLVPLFEVLQAAALLIIAFKRKIAKKSVIVMTAGLTVLLFVVLYFTVVNNVSIEGVTTSFQSQAGLRLSGAVVGMFAFYVFFICKTAAYIIISSAPKQFATRLLTNFGVGIGLIAGYILLMPVVGHFALLGAACGVIVLLVGGLITLVKSAGGGDGETLHGSARFAERKEFKELEQPLESGGFILAPAHPEGKHQKLVLPRKLTEMHGLILGGSGTGKSRGYFMANCAEARGTSLVVTDPKSELWKYTSGFHDKAMRYAPVEPEASFCFNWIPLCTDARMAELCARAIMTAGSTKNTDQFWIDSETAFLSAVFAHAATMDAPTPMTAYRLFTRQKPEELLEQLENSPSAVAREQAIIFRQTDARIKGAIVPAIAARMQFMRDPNIQIFTSAQTDAPNFGDLRRTPTAVYWCLREQDITRLRPLTSLFFTVMLEQIAGEQIPEGASGTPVTMFLDEFANIGAIPDFETTITLARGRGVAIWLGVQSLSQLSKAYGSDNAQTIMSNCTTKIALHGLDYQTAESVSRMLGEQTIAHNTSGFNFGMGGVSMNTGAAHHRRQLLTPDEVTRIEENEAIARTSNKYPMRIYKGYYNEQPKTAAITQTLFQVQAATVSEEESLVI